MDLNGNGGSSYSNSGGNSSSDGGSGSSGDSSTPAPTNLVISYSLLHQAAKDIEDLKPVAERMRVRVVDHTNGKTATSPAGSGGKINMVVNNSETSSDGDYWFNYGGTTQGTTDALGSLRHALTGFGTNWSAPTVLAADELGKLGSFFKGCGYAFQEADASMAASLNLGATMSAIMGHADAMSRYLDASDSSNPAYDPNATKPGEVPDPFSLTRNGLETRLTYSGGMSTQFTLGGDDPYAPTDGPTDHHVPNKLLTSETTTVDSGGMTYKETTTFGPDKGWGPDGPTQDTTQTVTNPDGTTQTIKTTIDPKTGAGTRTVTSDDDTTTTTRHDWTSDWT